MELGGLSEVVLQSRERVTPIVTPALGGEGMEACLLWEQGRTVGSAGTRSSDAMEEVGSVGMLMRFDWGALSEAEHWFQFPFRLKVYRVPLLL